MQQIAEARAVELRKIAMCKFLRRVKIFRLVPDSNYFFIYSNKASSKWSLTKCRENFINAYQSFQVSIY
jgi:hypothetical protein